MRVRYFYHQRYMELQETGGQGLFYSPAEGQRLSPACSLPTSPMLLVRKSLGKLIPQSVKLGEVKRLKEEGFCTARSCGFRPYWVYLWETEQRLGLEDLDTAVSSAPCCLCDSGLELSASQFSHLYIGYDCPFLSPRVALRTRRYWIGSFVQSARHSKSKGLLL